MTRTPRQILNLAGYLSGPTSGTPAAAGMAYVKSHLTAFGLTRSDLPHLRLVRDYRDIQGVHHVTWAQQANGIAAFDSFLRVNVGKGGRVVSVVGSPLAHFGKQATKPRVSAGAALGTALRNAGGTGLPLAVVSRSSTGAHATTFIHQNTARLVYFAMRGGARLAWLVQANASSTGNYEYVVDASSGELLFRANMVSFATGLAWDYFDSSLLPAGVGSQTLRTYPATWGPFNSTALSGNFSHVYVDANDDDTPTPGAYPAGDDIPASSGTTWNYPFQQFDNGMFTNCDSSNTPTYNEFPCSWDSATPNSWQTNVRQNAEQVWYYVNNFHDALQAAPIGFTPAAGNFQKTNPAGQGLGGDAVQAQVDDGANTGGGLPDGNHMDNANMSTAQDGQPPRMQMYLFEDGSMSFVNPDSNGGDDASIIYHEYTHGLSHRLVTYANGIPALNSWQSGMMGEAWSDWYAMDYLMKKGFDADTATVGDVQVGYFTGGGQTQPVRSQAMDCPVDPNNNFNNQCMGGNTPHYGGYTYADMGAISGGGPEVHADGEIWGETLWQIRQQLIASLGTTTGTSVAETLITRAMDLSVPNPSMLDMRNFILEADAVYRNNADKALLWSVFANRAMGWFAETDGGGDTSPTANTQTPPTANATLSGTVTATGTSTPVVGAVVAFSGHGDGADTLFAVTNASGQYTVSGLYGPHTYQATVTAPGYDALAFSASIASGTNSRNLSLKRDWAMGSGGGSVSSFTGPDYTGYGCGPSAAIDGSLSSGWGSASGTQALVVKLARPVNITGVSIDPGATCGDPDSASLAGYSVQAATSATGPWTNTVASGTFSAGNDHHLNAVTLGGTRTNMSYIRLVMSTNQGNPDFTDMSEIEVYGTPSTTVAAPTIGSFSPSFGPRGTKVTINGTNFTAAKAVQFNGQDAKFTVSSATKILATVPDSAPIGAGGITVTTAGGTARSSPNFTVTKPLPPTISGFTPASAPTGTTVTISGANLGGVTAVKFGTIAATFTMVSPGTTLKAVVPASLTATPSVKITVTAVNGTATSSTFFTVTLGISTFSPASGPAGTTVTVNGRGFNTSSKVKFNGVAATTHFVSSTQLTAVVPSTATTGKISVTNTTAPVGTVYSAATFTKT